MLENLLSKPEVIWFFIGLALFLLELVIPGLFIFFFALGAWVTALACLIFDPGINVQILVFAITSVLTLVLLRKTFSRRFFLEKVAQTDEIEDEFTGKDAVVLTDIEPGKNGTVEFKGTTWKAESDTAISAGKMVVIMKKESFKLIVQPKN